VARQRGGRDLRARSAALLNDDLLIDAGPDLGLASARLGLDLATVQALLLTHRHWDHLSPAMLAARARPWGGTPLPLLAIFGSRASLALIDDWDALRIAPHPIAPFQPFEVRTGGALAADPRRPLYPGLPPLAGALAETPPRRYQVTPLAARHLQPEDEAVLFAISQVEGPELAGRGQPPALLYATDTGPFLEPTWAALDALAGRGVRFGAAVVDATMGTGRPGYGAPDHLTLAQAGEHLDALARRGLLVPGARRIVHHFSHFFTPPHDQLAAMLAPLGLEPAYDGLVLTL
jgi:phosphoribosyl 1,2-cyclic phosphate phosphodiesterase